MKIIVITKIGGEMAMATAVIETIIMIRIIRIRIMIVMVKRVSMTILMKATNPSTSGYPKP